MTVLENDLKAWLNQRLDDMLAAPRMWGSLESVELQTLLILELRALVKNPTRERRNPRDVLEQYEAYLRASYPRRPSAPLHEILAEQGEAEFVGALRKFNELLEEIVLPENPFEHSELAIELRFSDRRPSATAFSSYYESFRKATRAIMRTGEAGRPTKAIEQATDFGMEGTQVIPRNGSSSAILLKLGRTTGQIDMEAEKQVRDAITGIVTMAEWADSDADVADLNMDDVESRTLTAVQTLRVVPQRGIDTAHIGGRLIGRTKPAVLKPQHVKRLVDVASSGSIREPFERTGEVRAIDLDRGTLRLGRKDVVDCFASTQLLEQVSKVGARVRVIGERFLPSGARKPFVLAKDIELEAEPRD